MKRLFICVLVIGIVFGLSKSYSQDAAAKKDGKTVFVDAKCTGCHAIKVADIKCKKEDTKAPDLSEIGSTAETPFLKKYLKKEEEHEGKKHPVAFKGDDGDFDTMLTWFATLKKAQK